MKFNFINIVPKIVVIYITFLLSVSCGSQQAITENDLIRQSTKESLDKFGAFIWSKKTKAIVMNTHNLNEIKNRGLKKTDYIKSLNRYLIFLIDVDYNSENITFPERSYIVAHIVNSLYEFREKLPKDHKFKDNEFALDIIFSDSAKNYYDEFMKKEYYGLVEFKEKYIKQYKENPPVIKKQATGIMNKL